MHWHITAFFLLVQFVDACLALEAHLSASGGTLAA